MKDTLLLLGAAAHAAVALAQSPGTFTAAGTMTVPRAEHTATLLTSGKVLITGGSGLVTAELYDPEGGIFTPTGDMTTPRSGHTATLLPDGKVLVAGGGRYGAGSVADAEIYHPNVTVPAPVLLPLPGNIQGSGAILHGATQQAVTPDSPAVAGEAIEIYGTVLIDRSVIPPQVAIGGTTAEVLWFGKAPGYDGLNLINVRVPNGLTPGPAVPVRLNYLSRPSNEVTLAIQ
jgi:hypothetical protein